MSIIRRTRVRWIRRFLLFTPNIQRFSIVASAMLRRAVVRYCFQFISTDYQISLYTALHPGASSSSSNQIQPQNTMF